MWIAIGIAGGWALLVLVLVLSTRADRKKLIGFLTERGFTISGEAPLVSNGRYRNLSFVVETFKRITSTRGSGYPVTRFRTAATVLLPNMILHRPADRVYTMQGPPVGTRYAATGDAEFDAQWRLLVQDQAAADWWSDASRRAALLAVGPSKGMGRVDQFKVSQGEVELVLSAVVHRVEILQRALDFVATIASGVKQ